MDQTFPNVYEDAARAEAYAKLEFPGTYYLAYRDLPAIIGAHIRGTRAMDFGCGTGRSTRFLKRLGFDRAIGVDIAEAMIAKAREFDPQGDYRLVSDVASRDPQDDGRYGADGGLEGLSQCTFDLVLSVFTFDNIPTMEKKVALFKSLGDLLSPCGRIVSLVSSPDIYVNEWASFSTEGFPENRTAKSGEKVRIVMLDVPDRRPVEDILFSDEDYREVYRRAGLALDKTYRPLACASEPFTWVSETEVAPWVIYVLRR